MSIPVNHTTEVAQAASHGPQTTFLTPDMNLMILTWITFLTLLAILYKFAWKPILAALDKREKDIRDAIDNADRLKHELTKIEERREQVIAQAEHKSKELINQGRKAAVEAGNTIRQKAREETQIMIENAQRELKDAVEKARADLREESAHMAVQLASKLIEENLDDEKNRKLVNRLIQKI